MQGKKTKSGAVVVCVEDQFFLCAFAPLRLCVEILGNHKQNEPRVGLVERDILLVGYNLEHTINAKAQGRRDAKEPVTENEISKVIVDGAIEVHREMGGPGLLEDIYEEAMEEELRLRGMQVERLLPVRLTYKGRILRKPLRLDMKVGGLVLVDNKAVSEWHPVFEAQMLTYLRLTGLKLGLVINFGERYVKNGIYRVVNVL